MNEAKTETIEQPTFSYRVVRGVLRRPRAKGSRSVLTNRADFIQQGDLIPDGLFPAEDLASWLADGRIARIVPMNESQLEQAREHNRHLGKWAMDPASVVGKSMADLLLMVIEIDPNYDTDQLQNEADAVRLLTQDWNPAFTQTTARSKDKTSPLNFNMEQRDGERALRSGNRQMSPQAMEALASARAKAQAPKREVTE